MGTYIRYTGSTKVAEDKKAIFSKQMERILSLGGMMELELIKLFGQDMILLKPVGLSKDNKVYFDYNYFEDSPWESCCYDMENARLVTEKVGFREFNSVVCAAYTLYEIYDEGLGLVFENNDVVSADKTYGWLNSILDTSFTMEKRFRIWELAEHVAFERIEDGYEDALPRYFIEDLVPKDALAGLIGLDCTDILCVIYGEKSLPEEVVQKDLYSADILLCKRAMERYFSDNEITDPEPIWNLLKKNISERTNQCDTRLQEIVELSLTMPARVFVYLTAEILNLEFWKTWKMLKDDVYKDERRKEYISSEVQSAVQEVRSKPVKKVSTCMFLRQQSPIDVNVNSDTSKKKTGFCLSDDDRLYWWDGTDDVVISEEMNGWLLKLAEEHRSIKDTINITDGNHFLKDFFMLFIDINEHYKRIYPFYDMFYEFLQNGSDMNYAAAVELLRRLATDEENREAGAVMKDMSRWEWDFSSKSVTQNKGRVELKRYLSVMANKKLRMKYFGF